MEFIQKTLTGINTVLTVGNILVRTYVSNMYDHLSTNEKVSSCLLKMFDVYVTTQMYICDGYQYAYTNFPIVRDISDLTVHYSKLFRGFVESYKVEPFQKHWVSTHILIKNNHLFKGNRFIHIENYQMMSTDLNPDCSYNEKIETGFMYFYNILQSLIVSLMHVVDAIVVMKDGDRYIVRSILHKHDKFYHKSSKRVFLSVSYKHPEMETSIAMEFPETMYEIGNVVFTPMFVKRYLEYQSLSYVFDDRYTLDIIDNDMNMLALNSNQYGLLTEDGWSIIDMSNKKTKEEIKEEEIKEEEIKEEEIKEEEVKEEEIKEEEIKEEEIKEEEVKEEIKEEEIE